MMKVMNKTGGDGYNTFLSPNLSTGTNNKLNLSTFNNPYTEINLSDFLKLGNLGG